MASDDLSQALLGLAGWISCVAAGTHELKPEDAQGLQAALDKAALMALALEARLDAALGRRPELAAVHAEIRAGRVVVLPTADAIHAVLGDLTVCGAPFSDGRAGPRPSSFMDP